MEDATNNHDTDGTDCDVFIKYPPYKGLFADRKTVTLDKLILKDSNITVSSQDGRSLSGSIEDVKTTISKEIGGTIGGRVATYKYVTFQKNTGEFVKVLDPSGSIESNVWDKVIEILKPEYNSPHYVVFWLMIGALILLLLIMSALK